MNQHIRVSRTMQLECPGDISLFLEHAYDIGPHGNYARCRRVSNYVHSMPGTAESCEQRASSVVDRKFTLEEH
jgi:hypothetical protein